MTLTHTSFQSPLGEVCLLVSEVAVCGLWFTDSHRVPDWMLASPQTQVHANKLLAEATRQLQAYWTGERKAFDMPIDLSWGTPFQQTVWRQLMTISYGHTCTYADVARAIGKPQGLRAVGTAIGRNPLSVIVPCHRVLGSNGQLSGYSGGLDRKRALLQLESQGRP
jgi:methylated-DNA-[protein]-cysteine S-methyltransferase